MQLPPWLTLPGAVNKGQRQTLKKLAVDIHSSFLSTGQVCVALPLMKKFTDLSLLHNGSDARCNMSAVHITPVTVTIAASRKAAQFGA